MKANYLTLLVVKITFQKDLRLVSFTSFTRDSTINPITVSVEDNVIEELGSMSEIHRRGERRLSLSAVLLEITYYFEISHHLLKLLVC